MRVLAALLLVLWAPCRAGEPASVLAGIDVLQERAFRELKGKKVGLITNQTGIDRQGRTTAHVLANAPNVELRALFSPEHGYTGTMEIESIASGSFALPDGTRIPLFSLYGATKTPTGDMLKDLDVLVFDVQDIGARFYTYATTMAMAMESAAAEGLDFVVLDRPNPIGGEGIEGPLLDADIRHFTAYFPIPTRHGLTMGEIARLHNIHGRVGVRLQVIPLKGWSRRMWYDDTGLTWTRPSPNMPDVEAAGLYPGIGCFEATNVSVGRGTPLPFRWIGAPWLKPGPVLKRLKSAKLKGVRFEAKTYTPEKSVHKGKKCGGILIRIKDRGAVRPLEIFAHLSTALRDTHPKSFVVRVTELARMTGTRRFVEQYQAGTSAKKMIRMFRKDSRRFRTERAPFLLY